MSASMLAIRHERARVRARPRLRPRSTSPALRAPSAPHTAHTVPLFWTGLLLSTTRDSEDYKRHICWPSKRRQLSRVCCAGTLDRPTGSSRTLRTACPSRRSASSCCSQPATSSEVGLVSGFAQSGNFGHAHESEMQGPRSATVRVAASYALTSGPRQRPCIHPIEHSSPHTYRTAASAWGSGP